MCDIDTLELIFLGLLVFILLCVLWQHRETIIRWFCGAHHKCGGTDSENGLDPKLADTPLSYNDKVMTMGEYWEIVSRDSNAISQASTLQWANDVLSQHKDMEDGLSIYMAVMNLYYRFIDMTPNSKIKKDLELNLNAIADSYSEYSDTIANMVGTELIFNLADVVNDIPSEDDRYSKILDIINNQDVVKTIPQAIEDVNQYMAEEAVDITEADEAELLKDILVEKKVKKPQAEPHSWFSKKSKIVAGTRVYIDNAVPQIGDNHPRLGEFLDGHLPIKIYFPRQIYPGWLSTFGLYSNTRRNAEKQREDAFWFIMEGTKIVQVGNHIPFIDFIKNWKFITTINAVNVYQWALDASKQVIEKSKTMPPEFIYSAYTIITRYYRAFIRITENKITKISKINAHTDGIEHVREYNKHICIMLENLLVGYRLIDEMFGKDMKKFSTEYINSMVRVFEDSAKKTFPTLVNPSTDKIKSRLMDKLRDRAYETGKQSVLLKKLTGKHKKITVMKPESDMSSETRTYIEDSGLDGIDDTNIESGISYKQRRRERAQHMNNSNVIHPI